MFPHAHVSLPRFSEQQEIRERYVFVSSEKICRPASSTVLDFSLDNAI